MMSRTDQVSRAVNSPYSPPASRIDGEVITLPELRRHGATIFALIPLLLLIVFEGLALYRRPQEMGPRAWDAALFFSLIAIMGAAIGFACAGRFAKSSKLGIVALGAAAGVLWALWTVTGTYSIIHFLFPGLLLFSWRAFGMLCGLAALLTVPVAIGLSTWIRYHGKKNGYR